MKDENWRKKQYMQHLACIGLARMLYRRMNFFEKRTMKKWDFEKHDELCAEKIKLLDKYSYILDEVEKKIYEENKDQVRFMISWSEK